MRPQRNLQVGRWAAVVIDADSHLDFGSAAAEDAIPASIRRRMGRLERLAVRCTLGVLERGATDELIFCSRHGNVETLVSLLRSVAVREPVSPMGFAGSVHNAVPGQVGQICKERLSHTALAAGAKTLSAGLIESYARLATDECRDVTLTFADVPLPAPFAAFEDESGPGIAIALRLRLADGDAAGMPVNPGRSGALEILDRLKGAPIVIDAGSWSGEAR
jgi:hypothetical protein